MSEILNQTMEHLPYVAAVAGAAGGIAVESIAARRHNRDEQALTDVIGVTSEQQPRESLGRKAKRIGAATLLYTGAVVGMLNGVAWQADSEEVVPPTLSVVVDHSGALASEESVLSTVDKTVAIFASDEFDATAHVASNGRSKSMEPDEVSNDEPFGPAPLSQAMQNAFGEIQKVDSESASRVKNKAAIFAVVNGNDTGNAADIIATAKSLEVPIFIANVEGESDRKGESDPAIADELKDIAKQTKGEYFDVSKDNAEEMASKITDTLEENELDLDKPNKLPMRVVAGTLSAAALAWAFVNRRKEPSRKRVTN